jgi:hypothetical protein
LQLITDVNIAVAVEAIQAIGNLARGLRTHFSASSRFLLPVLLVSTIQKPIVILLFKVTIPIEYIFLQVVYVGSLLCTHIIDVSCLHFNVIKLFFIFKQLGNVIREYGVFHFELNCSPAYIPPPHFVHF